MKRFLPIIVVLTMMVNLLPLMATPIAADTSGTYTLDADFNQGTLINVNHDVPDQLQLDDTIEQGSWNVIHDSGVVGTEWIEVNWNNEPEASVPGNASIFVEVRASDTEAGLGVNPWVSAINAGYLEHNIDEH